MSFYFIIKVLSEEIKVLSDKPITNQFSSFLWFFFVMICLDMSLLKLDQVNFSWLQLLDRCGSVLVLIKPYPKNRIKI